LETRKEVTDINRSLQNCEMLKSQDQVDYPMSKRDQMEIIDTEVRACPKCRLSKTRKNVVPGEGNLDSKVFLVGEAPGYWEDVKGRPFVGAAGELLNETLEKAGFSRSEVYITNIVKCRPPRNRDPRPDEVEACTPYLDRQLQLVKPRFIVTLGRHSTSHILSKIGYEISGITAVRGRIFEAELLGLNVRIIPMFHPAAAIYDAKLKDYLEKDLRVLKNELEKE